MLNPDLPAESGWVPPSNQGSLVVQHPQPISPSGIKDIHPHIKHEEDCGGLDSSSLPKSEQQGWIGNGYPQRVFGALQTAEDVLLQKKQMHLSQRVLGGTRPEDKLTDYHSYQPFTALQTKVFPKRDMETTVMIHRSNEHQVQSSSVAVVGQFHNQTSCLQAFPTNPVLHPKTKSFAEEVDISLGVDKKVPLKTVAVPTSLKSLMSPSDEELLAKFKKKKEKHTTYIQKESKQSVLLPRPISSKSPSLVTQPLQDPEAKFYEYSWVPRNDQVYVTKETEAHEDYHGDLMLSGSTHRVTEQDFLTATVQLPEINKESIWILDKDLHPKGSNYCEDVHFTTEKLAKGGFGTVSRCWDNSSRKSFIQKKMLKERWRKAENIAMMTLKGHANICQILGMKQDRDGDIMTISLFLEDAGMNLSQIVRMTLPDKLSLQKIWIITEQLFCGLEALHCHGILHLDLKPDNVCIQFNQENITLKIIDLGSAKLSQEPVNFCGMTPEYLAPEVCKYLITHDVKGLSEQLISSKADVASVALIILYMIEGYDVLIRVISNGQTSYAGKTEAEIKSLRAQLVFTHARCPDLASHLITEGIDVHLREFLYYCSFGNLERRFSSQDALQFIRGRKAKTKGPQLTNHSVATLLKQLNAKTGSHDKLTVTPSNIHLHLLRQQNQQGRGGLHTCLQATQAGGRMFSLNSQQDSHGVNNSPLRVSSHCKTRDKIEPYPTHRQSSCSMTEGSYIDGANLHLDVTGTIPATKKPEAYLSASDGHCGNLPNFDALQ